MRRNFILKLVLASTIILMLTALVANAQDVDNPWHLIVSDESGEKAAFNVETLSKLDLSGGSVKIENNWEGKITKYDYPSATTTFSFKPRNNGTGTGNEQITVKQWSILYANGNLHVSNPVGSVAIYTISGASIGQYPNQADISVSLSQGLYIVKSGRYMAKLLVTGNGTGNGTAASVQTTQAEANVPVLRSATYATPETRADSGIKVYWNITAGTNTATPVEIANVEKFKFTPEGSIVFTLKGGSTIELSDYKGLEFATTPAPTTSKWDMERTMKFGGASYLVGNPDEDSVYDIYAVAITKDNVVSESVLKKVKESVPIKNIKSPDFLTDKLGYAQFWYDRSPILVHYYKKLYNVTYYICYNIYSLAIDPNEPIFGLRSEKFAFNNGTPTIPTTIKLNSDDSLTIKFKDVRDGKDYSVVLTAP